MYVLIPFVAGLNSIEIFLTTTTIFTTLRLAMTLKFLYIYESKYEKAKQVANRFLWCLYNSMFVGLWVIDKCYADSDPNMEKYKKYISYLIAILLVFQAALEILASIADGMIFLYHKMRKACRKNKVQDGKEGKGEKA